MPLSVQKLPRRCKHGKSHRWVFDSETTKRYAGQAERCPTCALIRRFIGSTVLYDDLDTLDDADLRAGPSQIA